MVVSLLFYLICADCLEYLQRAAHSRRFKSWQQLKSSSKTMTGMQEEEAQVGENWKTVINLFHAIENS